MIYEEYLRQVVELAEAVMYPEKDEDYPEAVCESPARRELYEHFQNNETLAVQIDDAIREAVEPLFRGNTQKMHKIWLAICDKLVSNGYTDDEAEAEADILMEFTQRQEEYD